MFYWAEAVVMSVYLMNRFLSKSINCKTSYEVWYGRKLSVNYIRIFGLTVYVYLNKQQIKYFKLSDRVRKLVFVGFTDGIKVYKFFDFQIKQIIYSRSVVFDESFVGYLSEGGYILENSDD